MLRLRNGTGSVSRDPASSFDNARTERRFGGRYPPSDHCDGQRFFNPGVETDRGFADLLRWRRTRRPVPWPERVPVAPASSPPAPPPGEISLTFVGHATVLIRTATATFLTDPMFSERASPFATIGPRRVRAPGLRIEDLPPLDAVLLSHNHYDHMDLPSLRRIAARAPVPIVTGLGNGPLLRRAGIERVIERDWWEEVPPIAGAHIAFVPAQHWSSRTMLDRRRTLWGGHVVRTEAGTLFFAGDSGYGPHFAAIGRRFGIDVALLPIGAYEPRWFMRAQHMDPAEAVEAHRDLGARASFALHWGVFQLTDEAIDAPVEALAEARAAAGLEPASFAAPLPGEVVRWRRGRSPENEP